MQQFLVYTREILIYFQIYLRQNLKTTFTYDLFHIVQYNNGKHWLPKLHLDLMDFH